MNIFSSIAAFYNQMNQPWHLVDNLEKVFTIIGILIAGVWTYFNFFKGRTYRSRLEVHVSGNVLAGGDSIILVPTIELKNVGLSRVPIEQKGSALSVFSYDRNVHYSSISTVPWKRLAVFPVFEDHDWIEPGETINDHRAIVIPKTENIVFQLEARIVSSEIAWNAKAVVQSPET